MTSNTAFSKLTDSIFVSDSPWQFRILLAMVIAFFIGGLGLDYLASRVNFPVLSGSADNLELDKLVVEFTKTKHDSLSGSASLLYDFSKIALGALIASITQHLRIDTSKGKEGENKS